ncbi:MAG: terminase small subunit [Akkermansiaceae bacterium]|nr:terminase small subunit [Akkermansiaceae bacterium]
MKKNKKSRPLTSRQQRFCEFVAAGETQTDAWLRAGYKVSRNVARRNAAESLTKPDIKAHLAELRAPQTAKAKMTKERKLIFLAEIIRTPIGEIGPDSPLCQEFSEIFSEKGGTSTRIKMPDKLRALELHSKLVGDFEAEKVQVESKTLADIEERAKHVVSTLNLFANRRKGMTAATGLAMPLPIRQPPKF